MMAAAPRMLGRYQLLGRLGEGSMAVVVRAFDPVFKREVAIKVARRKFADDPAFRQRFIREARTAARLEHPAIVPVYDAGQDGDDLYLVMRLMEGGNLTSRIQRDSLTPAEVALVVQRIGAALDYAHSLGLVHRDVKPQNIFFDQEGQPYLSDFGVVRHEAGGEGDSADGWMGTPMYMSPEQVLGGALDGRSDLYSLGVVLFEMLTGETPYQADRVMGVAMKHVIEPIPHIQARNQLLPRAWQQVIQTALAKKPDQRYASGQVLGIATLKVATQSRQRSGQVLPHSVWWGIVALLGLALLAGLVWGSSFLEEEGAATITPTLIATVNIQTTVETHASPTPDQITNSVTVVTQVVEAVAGAQLSATLLPTATPSPPTATPTVALAVRVLGVRANVHSGPGAVYEVVAGLAPGAVVEVVARNRDGNWYLIPLPARLEWTSSAVVEPAQVGATASVPVALTIPPIPITSTFTPSLTSTSRPPTLFLTPLLTPRHQLLCLQRVHRCSVYLAWMLGKVDMAI